MGVSTAGSGVAGCFFFPRFFSGDSALSLGLAFAFTLAFAAVAFGLVGFAPLFAASISSAVALATHIRCKPQLSGRKDAFKVKQEPLCLMMNGSG